MIETPSIAGLCVGFPVWIDEEGDEVVLLVGIPVFVSLSEGAAVGPLEIVAFSPLMGAMVPSV